ncbi:MAG: hypothetical protein KDA88_03080 [Planctomycetaceae bacterium]|nr:hypothetical protein [Planctomycetaceae bacterium]
MLACEYQLLEEVANWRLVLSTYVDSLEEDASPGEEATDDENAPAVSRGPRYIPRIHHIEGVPPEEMAPTHGRLIALGWLQFQIESQEVGLTYRVTAEGRQALNTIEPQAGEPVPDEPEPQS